MSVGAVSLDVDVCESVLTLCWADPDVELATVLDEGAVVDEGLVDVVVRRVSVLARDCSRGESVCVLSPAMLRANAASASCVSRMDNCLSSSICVSRAAMEAASSLSAEICCLARLRLRSCFDAVVVSGAGRWSATSFLWTPGAVSYCSPRCCAMKAERARRNCCCSVLCFASSFVSACDR